MIVAYAVGFESVRMQRALQRFVAVDDRARAVLRRFLFHVIATQKIHDVREHRRGDVVQKTCDRLFFIMREAPDDPRDADAVVETRIRLQSRKARKGSIFAAAVHADGFEPFKGGRRQTVADGRGDFPEIDRIVFHAHIVSAFACKVKAAACINRLTPARESDILFVNRKR